MNSIEIMSLAVNKANETMAKGYGGPFGAAVVDKEGTIVAVSSNSVLKDHDPTAHGEVNAIRSACSKLGTHDLSNYVLYTTAYPCPMCLGAIMWAGIKKVYYGCTASDTANIGFRDKFMYDFLDILQNKPEEYYLSPNKDVLSLENTSRENCLELFENYQNMDKELY